jgi:hypothetical protein
MDHFPTKSKNEIQLNFLQYDPQAVASAAPLQSFKDSRLAAEDGNRIEMLHRQSALTAAGSALRL